jgi:ferritin-like metal-binding protein YciE
MPIKDPKEIFVTLLSDVRSNTERAAKFYEEVDKNVQDPDISEALKARALISEQALTKIDRCFSLIGEKPIKLSGRLQEVFIEDFRKEVNEIQSPVAKQLFVLAKLNHLSHFRVGEYMALTAAADVVGNYAVGLLLESCLADNLAFGERTRRLIRNVIEEKVEEKLAA